MEIGVKEKSIKAKITKKPLCVRYGEVLRLRQILQSQLSKSPVSKSPASRPR
jgi:hypothetical protein